jgi:hypothetical protein
MTDLERRLRGGFRDIAANAPPFAEDNVEPSTVRKPTRQRPMWRTVGVAAAVAGVLIAAPVTLSLGSATDKSTSARQPGGDETPTSRNAGTTPSHATVDEVAARMSRYWAEPGFGKVRLSYERGLVWVYWHGPPPTQIADADGTVVDGVGIEVLPTAFSDDQLVEAGRRAATWITDRYGTDKFAASLPNEDLSGLIVEVVRPWDGEVDQLERAAGVPVSIRVVNSGPDPLLD